MLKRIALVFVALAIAGLGFLPSNAAAQTAPPDTSSILVKLIAGLTTDDQAAVIARNGGTETSAIAALRLHVIQVPTAELADTMARYTADPQVQHVEENKVRRTEFLSNDPLVTSQWVLPQIGWDLVFGTVVPTGTAKVAILDTGIDATHPDLAGRVVAGTSILDGSNGMTDSHGHGTQVAGIVAAKTDNATGVAGIGFAGVQVMPVTVLDANGEGRDSDVIAGVLWAADNGADVILMAFSNPGFSPNLQDAIDYAWSRGVVLVAAIGNDGVSTPSFPAGDRGVIGASGTDTADALLGYSNSGQAAFLAAPGENIATTDLGGGYVAVSGTSSSAAIIAGVAAFLKAVDPTLTNGMIVGRMARTADPAGTQDQTGNGRVNMARALTDTGTDSIQPAGADPVGDGGPFVGPYRAASRNFVVNFAGSGTGSVAISVNGGNTIQSPGGGACTATGGAFGSSSVTISATCTNLQSNPSNTATVTFAASANSGSIFAGWTGASNFTGSSTCNDDPTPDTTNPCSAVLGNNATLTVTFNLNANTTTAVISSANPSVLGQSVTFTATVTPNPGATGTIQFKIDGVDFGAPVALAGGSATSGSASSLAVGNHTITAIYSGGSGFNGSTSPNFTQVVNKADSLSTVGSSVNPSVAGQSVTFTATVTAVAPGSGTPTGTVQFKIDGVDFGAPVALAGGSATSGSTTTLSVASHSITAVYSGDGSFNASGVGSSTASILIQNVQFNFTGFFQPIDNLPALNQVKAGSAIPIKFSLHGNQGLNIFAAGYPKSMAIVCGSGVPIDDVEETLTAGNSTLSYDPGSDQYIYVWKTDKSWVGQCRQLDVKFIDDTEHFANFKFK
jgi:subtilase family protein/Big-like domain-containing protein/fervidolysin-like protein